jgi:hypothetical protein
VNIIRYTVNITNLDLKKLLDPWKWLIGEDKEIMVITKIGDVVLKDADNKLYLLSIADGTMEFLSNYSDDFYKIISSRYFAVAMQLKIFVVWIFTSILLQPLQRIRELMNCPKNQMNKIRFFLGDPLV